MSIVVYQLVQQIHISDSIYGRVEKYIMSVSQVQIE